MESFDQFVDQNLDEAISDVVGRKVSNAIGPRKFTSTMAKFGSKSAKGQISYQKMVDKLNDDFREYLGEQGIRKPVIDDVLDYLKNRVGFQAPDDLMARLAYGGDATAKPQNAAVITAALQQVDQAIEQRIPLDQNLVDAITNAAESDDAAEIMVRRGLYSIARANPASARTLAPVAKYIGGKPIERAMLLDLFGKVARMLLKVGKNNPYQQQQQGKPGQATMGQGVNVNNDLDEGPTVQPSAKAITRGNPKNPPTWVDDMANYGLPVANLKSYAQFAANPNQIITHLNSQFSSQMCAKLIRMCMVWFIGYGQSKALDSVIALCETQQPGFKAFADSIIPKLASGGYKKGDINKVIFQQLSSSSKAEHDTAQVLGAMLIVIGGKAQ